MSVDSSTIKLITFLEGLRQDEASHSDNIVEWKVRGISVKAGYTTTSTFGLGDVVIISIWITANGKTYVINPLLKAPVFAATVRAVVYNYASSSEIDELVKLL